MLVEKINGGWSVCDLIDGHLISRRYMGYTKRDAMRAFRDEMKKGKS